MCMLKSIYVPNFSSLGWFSFSSTAISCWQLLTAVESWWQLIWKKLDWNFYVHTKVDTCAEFQLSRLIFIFVSFWQLLSAVDSWWQLSQQKFSGDFIYPLDVKYVPNLRSVCCSWAWLESVTGDGRRVTGDGSRLTPGKTRATQAQPSWCLCLRWAI